MKIPIAIGRRIREAGVAACIDWAIRFPDGRVGAVLNWRPLVFIGRISYSLYLWHVPVLVGTQAILRSSPARVGLELPVVVVVAVASYYIVEQPLRRRFASPRGRAAQEVPALQQPLQVPGQRLTRTFAEG